MRQSFPAFRTLSVRTIIEDTLVPRRDSKFKSVSALMRKADKLASGERGYSRIQKPGYIRLLGGGWRDPEVHREVIDLYTQALALDEPPYFALQCRAMTHLQGDSLDEALADLKLLEERKSVYATGVFPLQLYLARGERDVAQRYLDEINARNKAKGIPKQSFSDFRLD